MSVSNMPRKITTINNNNNNVPPTIPDKGIRSMCDESIGRQEATAPPASKHYQSMMEHRREAAEQVSDFFFSFQLVAMPQHLFHLV